MLAVLAAESLPPAAELRAAAAAAAAARATAEKGAEAAGAAGAVQAVPWWWCGGGGGGWRRRVAAGGGGWWWQQQQLRVTAGQHVAHGSFPFSTRDAHTCTPCPAPPRPGAQRRACAPTFACLPPRTPRAPLRCVTAAPPTHTRTGSGLSSSAAIVCSSMLAILSAKGVAPEQLDKAAVAEAACKVRGGSLFQSQSKPSPTQNAMARGSCEVSDGFAKS